MKKLFILFTACTLISFTACSQTNSQEKGNQVEITFEETSFDYGTVAYESDGSHEFIFKNTGKEPLLLSNVSSSCGCTIPEWPKEPIEPGKTGKIKVKYNTRISGPFTKSVTVFSNASNSPVSLRITGKVENPASKP